EPPVNILLATDLGAHSDRALDRAAQLARQWRATLHVVHAIHPETIDVLWPTAAQAWRLSMSDERPVSDVDVETVRQQDEHDLHDTIEVLIIHVTLGEPATVILETA